MRCLHGVKNGRLLSRRYQAWQWRHRHRAIASLWRIGDEGIRQADDGIVVDVGCASCAPSRVTRAYLLSLTLCARNTATPLTLHHHSPPLIRSSALDASAPHLSRAARSTRTRVSALYLSINNKHRCAPRVAHHAQRSNCANNLLAVVSHPRPADLVALRNAGAYLSSHRYKTAWTWWAVNE